VLEQTEKQHKKGVGKLKIINMAKWKVTLKKDSWNISSGTEVIFDNPSKPNVDKIKQKLGEKTGIDLKTKAMGSHYFDIEKI
tara:strand:+ start:133 stop:378 length:246 start_codon:yes stop_codon:yes gene_type:complete